MTGFYPTNQNTLYLLHLFYSDNEIKTVRGRPAICTLIGWFKSSRLFISLFGFCGFYPMITVADVKRSVDDVETGQDYQDEGEKAGDDANHNIGNFCKFRFTQFFCR